MDFSLSDIQYILPLIVLSGGILISLVLEMYSKKSEEILPWFSTLILFFGAYYSLISITEQRVLFGGMLATGGLVNIFTFIFTFGGALVSLLSTDYLKKTGINHGEFYIILQSAILGMMLLAAAQDMIMIFIGLEQMSIPFYILAGFKRKSMFSNEAAMKYFLLGAFATGFIVYGMALIFGSVGSLSLPAIFNKFMLFSEDIIFVFGIILFIIGFSFKIAAFPFHMWVPDVYQGAPTIVTALMSTTGKSAAFAAIILIISPITTGLVDNFLLPYFAALAVLSMLFGSIVAIAQDDLKRMLAYSSIAHAGYMLIGISTGSLAGVSGVVFYLAAYTFMNIGAFGILSLIEGENESNLNVKDYHGLSSKYPLLAALLAVFMFALSGIPPFAGFFGKYYVFVAAIENGQTWLALVGILSSVISVYFYLRVVVVMYFKPAEKTIIVSNSYGALLSIIISVLLVIIMGVAPGSIIELISAFVG